MGIDCDVSFVRVPGRPTVVHGRGTYFKETWVSEAHRPAAGMWWGYALVRSPLSEQLIG